MGKTYRFNRDDMNDDNHSSKKGKKSFKNFIDKDRMRKQRQKDKFAAIDSKPSDDEDDA